MMLRQRDAVHVVIRKFHPSDQAEVITLFRNGVQEHIIPTFINAFAQPFHITIALCFFIAGYIMTGGSVILAFLAGASWICLVLYCCYEFFTGYFRLKLRTDMRDIQSFYLSNPDNCFWVAEAEVNGRSQIIGIVAVEGKNLPGNNNQKYGELFRMMVSSAGRRKGLGSQLLKTAIDFCKNSGFSKIELETSSTQKAAIALYVKMGFTILKPPCIVSVWVSMLTRITVFKMEKLL